MWPFINLISSHQTLQLGSITLANPAFQGSDKTCTSGACEDRHLSSVRTYRNEHHNVKSNIICLCL